MTRRKQLLLLALMAGVLFLCACTLPGSENGAGQSAYNAPAIVSTRAAQEPAGLRIIAAVEQAHEGEAQEFILEIQEAGTQAGPIEAVSVEGPGDAQGLMRALEKSDASTIHITVPDATDEDKRVAVAAVQAVGYEPEAYAVTVTYKSDAIFSGLVAFELDGGETQLLPVTLSLPAGAQVPLSDFFRADRANWRGVLADIVTEAALYEDLTLLCDILPVGDTQPYFILEGAIVLLYRPYEITTYEAGSPCFILPMARLEEYTTGAYGIGNGDAQ